MRFRLAVLQVVSTLLGLVGLAAGGGAIWATHTYRPAVAQQLEAASVQLGTAQTMFGGALLDVEHILGLVPEVETTLRRTADMLGNSHTALGGLRDALRDLGPALQSMAGDLRTLATSLGTMARGSNLIATAGQLDEAGRELTGTLAPIGAMMTDLDTTEDVVRGFADEVAAISAGLHVDATTFQDAAGGVGDAQTMLRSDRLPQVLSGIGYGLGGLLLFLGLCLLVLARTQAALARSL